MKCSGYTDENKETLKPIADIKSNVTDYKDKTAIHNLLIDNINGRLGSVENLL